MGYKVAIMADSTSRWAEALREMIGRLEEMPGERGLPCIPVQPPGGVYERAGRWSCNGSDGRTGRHHGHRRGIPARRRYFGAGVPGNAAHRQGVLGPFGSLAYRRHFPAIDWLQSYSLYPDQTGRRWFDQHVGSGRHCAAAPCASCRRRPKLDEIVRLVGQDALSFSDRLTLEVARSIREDYLHQNAFHEVDTYTSLQKQVGMLTLILQFHTLGPKALDKGATYPGGDVACRCARGSAAPNTSPEDEGGDCVCRIGSASEGADGGAGI